MSWNVTLFGYPEAIVRELDAVSGTLSGMSKEEYDKALPLLKGIVALNFVAYENSTPQLLKLSASGHGTKTGTGAAEKMIQSTCLVQMENVYGKVLV